MTTSTLSVSIWLNRSATFQEVARPEGPTDVCKPVVEKSYDLS